MLRRGLLAFFGYAGPFRAWARGRDGPRHRRTGAGSAARANRRPVRRLVPLGRVHASTVTPYPGTECKSDRPGHGLSPGVRSAVGGTFGGVGGERGEFLYHAPGG